MCKAVTEIVTMKCLEGISKENFISIVHDLECRFHSVQNGFIDTELLYEEKEDLWIMIQHWESAQQMKAASNRMFQDSVTEQFRMSIDPKQIKICAYPVLGTWNRNEAEHEII